MVTWVQAGELGIFKQYHRISMNRPEWYNHPLGWMLKPNEFNSDNLSNTVACKIRRLCLTEQGRYIHLLLVTKSLHSFDYSLRTPIFEWVNFVEILCLTLLSFYEGRVINPRHSPVTTPLAFLSGDVISLKLASYFAKIAFLSRKWPTNLQ